MRRALVGFVYPGSADVPPVQSREDGSPLRWREPERKRADLDSYKTTDPLDVGMKQALHDAKSCEKHI